MSKYIREGAGILLLAMLVLSGCSQAKVPDTVNVTSLVVSEQGEVTYYLADTFDKDYYNITDLTAMAMEEADSYNSEHLTGDEAPVKVEKVEALDDGSGTVVVTQKFTSVDAFVDFNDGKLFYGTVGEAIAAGYDMDVILRSVKDGSLITKEDIVGQMDKHILITEEQAVIYCPYKVGYTSDEAVYQDNGAVNATEAEDPVVILMKK